MLPKKIRLTTGLFDQVFKTGRVYNSPLFWMRSLPSPNGLPSRFAVAVPKKVAQTAVLRNKIKRIVYRAIEMLVVDTSINQSASMVIFGAKKDVSQVPFEAVVKELKDLQLKKAQK